MTTEPTTGPVTTVRHVNDVDRTRPDVWYVGRAVPSKGLTASRWRNPWRIGDPHPDTGTPITRDDAVDLYRTRTVPLLLRDPAAVTELEQMRGGTLTCWCPNREGRPDVLTADYPFLAVCHAQIVAGLADSTRNGRHPSIVDP